MTRYVSLPPRAVVQCGDEVGREPDAATFGVRIGRSPDRVRCGFQGRRKA